MNTDMRGDLKSQRWRL